MQVGIVDSRQGVKGAGMGQQDSPPNRGYFKYGFAYIFFAIIIAACLAAATS
jgi:hypothetical protein